MTRQVADAAQKQVEPIAQLTEDQWQELQCLAVGVPPFMFKDVMGCVLAAYERMRPCCDMHNRHCEPPSELCCWKCTEADHPRHPQGVACTWTQAGTDAIQ